MRRSKGFRNKTRRTLKKRDKRRTTVADRLKEINIGETVVVKQNPSFQKGMPHPRFYGKTGEVVEKQGNVYKVKIMDGNKPKELIAKIEHLKQLKGDNQ